MANPFYVEPANPLQALMTGVQGYDAANKRAKEDQLIAGRQQAMQALQNGGDLKNVLSTLIGYGDVNSAKAIAEYANNQATQQYRQAALAQTGEHNRGTLAVSQGQLDLAREQAKEKPSIVKVKDENGSEHLIRTTPQGNDIRDVTPAGLINQQPANPYATAGAKPMLEHEAKAALFADRAATAHSIINQNQNINNEPGGTFGAIVEKSLPEGVSNFLVSDQRGQLMNAKRSFINALLRRESGAAINAGEFASYDKEYFPQPGDSPTQIANKQAHRAEVIRGLAREGGKNYQPNFRLLESGGIETRPPPIVGSPKDQGRLPPGVRSIQVINP